MTSLSQNQILSLKEEFKNAKFEIVSVEPLTDSEAADVDGGVLPVLVVVGLKIIGGAAVAGAVVGTIAGIAEALTDDK